MRFAASIPLSPTKSSNRSGLTEEQRHLLREFLRDETAVRSAWPDEFAATRNTFLITAMLVLGHRVGEFLALLVSDFDLERGTYLIRRTHDMVEDPRVLQPLVKGYQRELRLPPVLLTGLKAYLRRRAFLPRSPRSDFLFITHDGVPLSRRSVCKIFETLRDKLPELGEHFCAHVLRHTWNDCFSEVAEGSGIPEEQAIRARMLAMGWTSRATAKTYTSRSDQKVAANVCLEIQNLFFPAMEAER